MNDIKSYLENPQETKNKIKKALAEKVFYQFVRQAWQWIDPNPYQDNWHIKFLCDHIQAFHENKIENLGINIPPGFAKSLLSSVLYPAWVWVNKPNFRFLTGSNASDLAIRDCRKARILLASEWYQNNWGDRWSFKSDENTKSSYENNQGGFRNVFSIQGHVTGFRGDERLFDDPHDAKFSNNIDRLKSDCGWYDMVFSSRSDPLKPSKTLIIMQRLSPDDLIGHIKNKNMENWTFVSLPWEFELDNKCKTIIGEDIRIKDGEYLWNNERVIKNMDSLKKQLGSFGAAGQLQQRPFAAGGNIFKQDKWKYYDNSSKPKYEYKICSLDSAWKVGNENDRSVCTTWGIYNGNAYLDDMWADRVSYPDLKVILHNIAITHNPSIIFVEDAASGIAIVQEMLRTTNLPIQPIRPVGDKVVRAHAITTYIEQGRVFLPKDHPMLLDYLNEMSSFPKAKHDDIVDSTTMALSQIFKYYGDDVSHIMFSC